MARRALWMVCGGRRATLGDRGTQEPPQVRVRPLGPVTRDTQRAFPQSTPRCSPPNTKQDLPYLHSTALSQAFSLSVDSWL